LDQQESGNDLGHPKMTMTAAQKFLAGLIALELVGAGSLWRSSMRPSRPPPVAWDKCMIDDATARAIRETEERLQPRDPASWMELAATYRAFGLFPHAEHCYRQADKLSPKDRSYFYYWAECFDLMGDTAQATRLYRRIIKEGLSIPLGPLTAQYCWLNIGQDFLRTEEVEAAIEALRQAPDLPKAKFLLARVLIRSGRAAEATLLLDELLRKAPDIIEFNQMKSWAETELGHDETARTFYEGSLRCREPLVKWDPTYREVQLRRKAMGSQAWHEKSLELAAKGKLEQAREWSRKAIEAFWTEDRVQQLAKVELGLGHLQEAAALAEDSVKRVGASAATLDIIGVASVRMGDRARARRAWEQAWPLEPTPNLFQKLAELSRLEGDLESARWYRGLEQYQLGKDAWLSNDLNTARGHLEQAVLLADRHAHAWFYLAETRRLLDDAPGAAAAYRRCLEINPDHGRALRALQRLNKAGVN